LILKKEGKKSRICYILFILREKGLKMIKKHRISEQTFEFLTLFTMVVGTVIGAGIYIKNTEIIKATQNPIISIML